jgi:hypothetical protein
LIFSCDTAQDPYGKAFTASHWATFSPRLGLVWDPKGNGRQTLRASFNLLHDTTELYYPERWTTNSPYASFITLTSGQFSNPFATYVLNGKTGDPFPGVAIFPTQGTYVSVPPNLKPTSMMQWNLSYQRQLGNDWVMKANYMGNASRHIWGSIDVDYAIPIAGATTANTNTRRLAYLANPTLGQYYGDIQQTDDGANAEYHGLLVSIEHRFARHYTLLSNYGWSHCTSSWDFAGELSNPIYQNPTNHATGERGNCGYDHRQVFNTTLVATSPGSGGGVAKMITRDWQVAPIFNTFTGNPIQIIDGTDVSLSGQNSPNIVDRPNVAAPGQVHVVPSGDPPRWFNPAAFVVQPSGTFGNLGRNAVYGPGQINLDMSLSRRFQVKERWKLDFRADFFNILNHANWNNPTTTITSSAFGEVTTFGSPRLIQMGMKLVF